MNDMVRRGSALAVLLLVLPCGFAQPDGKKAVKDKALAELLEKTRAKHELPGMAAAVIRSGEPTRLAVAGIRKRGTEVRAGADDQWHLGSNSKPITAFLIALLIDLGLLDWDTPLEQIFPEHAAKWKDDMKKITPTHLLTHTSGLPNFGPLKRFMLATSAKSPAQDRAQAVKDLVDFDLSAKPGEKYEYANLGYVLLGAIIDRRGKGAWEDQIKSRIFQPLGIKHWGLGPPSGNAVAHPWPHYAEGKPVIFGILDNPLVFNSAGRIRMSVGDYSLFLGETLKLARGEKGLLKPATAKKLFTIPYPASQHSLSAWGTNRKEPGKGAIMGHDGSNTFNYCTVIMMPDENLAVCVMTNQGGPGGPGGKACLEVRKELSGK